MSRSVDDRVVRMQFDNQRFESNVQQSLGTLEKLKGALNFDKSEKSMHSLEQAFRNFDLGSFGENLQKIADRFSTMGIIGDQVIRKLTDAFMGLTGQVTNLIKSMTFDQVAAGWGKYTDKTASVQTIMNATGKSINEVNGYLDKLMWFADETSYGFTDMTAALGQLTTAGGDIESLIPMIEGIANATAYAGKGPAEFSRAIYNLNQSYSSGALKYMDWKSLELAGVASKELKQTFIDTAVAMGKIDKGAVNIGNFSETLKDNWADTEVMEAAFGKFGKVTEEAYKLVQEGKFDTASDAYASLAGQFDEIYYKAARSAQEAKSFAEVIDATRDAVSSGWMKTFELIFGNYEEAKVLWTDMANSFWEIFASGADSRNDLLDEWHEAQSGGYKDFAQAISNLLQAIISAKEMLGDIVHNILPEFDSTHLIKATEAFKQFSIRAKTFFSGDLPGESEGLEIVKNGSENLRDELIKQDKEFGNLHATYLRAKSSGEMFANGMSGIVHLINIARKGFITLKNSLSPLGQVFKALTKGSLVVFDAFGHLFELLDKSLSISDGFKGSLEGISESVADFITNAANKISEFIYSVFGFDEATGKIKIFTDSFSGLKSKVDSFKENKYFKNFLDTINGLKDAFSFVKREMLGVLTNLPSLLPTIGKGLGYVGQGLLAVTGFIGRTFTKINNLTKSGSLLSGIINLLVAGFKKLGEILKPVGEKIKEIFSVISVGNFEGFKNIMSGILKGVASFSVFSLAKSGKGFLGSISETFDGITGLLNKFKGSDDIAKQILNIGIAIGILAGSLLLLSSIKPEALSVGIKGLSTLFIEIGTFMLVLKEMSGQKGKGLNPINSVAKTLIKIASAMAVFSIALKILSTIDAEKMTVALMGFGTTLAAIAAFMMVMKEVTNGGKAKDIKRVASSVTGIAAGMLILSAAMKVFGTMSMEQITNGLIAIVGFLGMVTVMYAAFDKMDSINAGKILAIGASIAIISNAMLILSGAIGIISLIPLGGIAKAVAAIASIMGLITLMAKLSNEHIKGMLAAAGAIAIIAPSLLILAGVIAALGALKLKTIFKGLIGLGGAIAILSIGLKAMEGSIKGSAALLVASVALLALAPAIALLGAVPLANIGKALLAMAGTFVVLWAGSILLSPIAPILLTLSGALLAFGAAIALAGAGFALLGAGMTMVAASGVAGAYGIVKALEIIIKGIGQLQADIVLAIVTVIDAVVDGLVHSIPKIVTGLGTVLLAVLTYLDEHAGEIFEKVISIILQCVNVINEHMPELIDAGVRSVVSLIQGLADALRNNSQDLADAVGDLLDSLVNVVLDLLEELVGKVPLIGPAIAEAIHTLRDYASTTVGGNSELKYGVAADTYRSTGGQKQYLNKIFSGLQSENFEERNEAIKAYEELSKWVSERKDWEVKVDDAGQVIDYGKMYDDVMAGREYYNEAQHASLATINQNGEDTKNAVKEIKKGIAKDATDPAFISQITDAGSGVPKAFESGLLKGKPGLLATARTVGDQVSDEFSPNKLNIESNGQSVLEMFAQGLIKGLKSVKSSIEETARSISGTLVKNTRTELQIKSPSRVAEEIGMYWDLGLAGGMTKYADAINHASNSSIGYLLGNVRSAVDAASGMLDKSASNVDSITPVLSLGNGAKGLKGLRSAISSQNDFANRATYGKNQNGTQVSTTTNTRNYGGFTITVNAAPGQNPKELARVIMEEIQAEAQRKEAALA